jgi:MFS family permease
MRHGLHAGGISQILREPVHGYPILPSSPLPPSPADATASGLRNSAFVPFVMARMLSMFAQQMQAVVVAWQVYDLTRDPMSLAYVGLAQFLPMLALLIPAGDLSDRMSRKRLLSGSWAVAALCSLLLLWLSWHEGAAAHDVHWIYAVLVLFGCSRAFTGPALQSLLPQIVPREQLAQALATNSMLMRTAAIAAPVLGGLLYAWGGAVLTYAVCGASLVLAVLLLTTVPVRFAEAMAPAGGSLWLRFGEGIHFIRTRPIILGTISLDLSPCCWAAWWPCGCRPVPYSAMWAA